MEGRYVIPNGLDVTLTVRPTNHQRGNRENLTCFKCGGAYHFRSECSTFRTRLCVRWRNGTCNDPFCAFAHGESQLRQPWRAVCVRFFRDADGRVQSMGCGQFGHVFTNCPNARLCEPVTQTPRKPE